MVRVGDLLEGVGVDGAERGGEGVVALEEQRSEPDPGAERQEHLAEHEGEGDGHQGRQQAEPTEGRGRGSHCFGALLLGECQRRAREHPSERQREGRE